MILDKLMTDVGTVAYLVHLTDRALYFAPGVWADKYFAFAPQTVTQVFLANSARVGLYPLEQK